MNEITYLVIDEANAEAHGLDAATIRLVTPCIKASELHDLNGTIFKITPEAMKTGDGAAFAGVLHSTQHDVRYLNDEPVFPNYDGKDYVDPGWKPSAPVVTEREPTQDGGPWFDDDPPPGDKLRRIPIHTFISEQVKIEYLVDEILRRGWLYALTGTTGSGKTAVAVNMACHVDLGRNFSGKEVQRGRVLYVAGENADEVRERFIVACDKLGTAMDIEVIAESFLLNDRVGELVESMGEHGDVLVIVDTDQAISLRGGTDENANAERMVHARQLRQLTRAKSRPTVLDLCHPIKHASREDLVPRGGGAFLNEVDGNFRLWREGDTAELFSDPNKFRGAPVSIGFALELLGSDRIVDTKGRRILTRFYNVVSDEQHAMLRQEEWTDENRLLWAMNAEPGGTQVDWARTCGWFFADTEPKKPRKDKVYRLLKKLDRDKMVKQARSGRWTLTDAGKKEAMKP